MLEVLSFNFSLNALVFHLNHELQLKIADKIKISIWEKLPVKYYSVSLVWAQKIFSRCSHIWYDVLCGCSIVLRKTGDFPESRSDTLPVSEEYPGWLSCHTVSDWHFSVLPLTSCQTCCTCCISQSHGEMFLATVLCYNNSCFSLTHCASHVVSRHLTTDPKDGGSDTAMRAVNCSSYTGTAEKPRCQSI